MDCPPPDVARTMAGTGDVIVSERFFVVLRCVGSVESVTVTATVKVPEAVGVPLITPVEAAIVRPAGKPVAVQL